jgi:hypothetical protein
MVLEENGRTYFAKRNPATAVVEVFEINGDKERMIATFSRSLLTLEWHSSVSDLSSDLLHRLEELVEKRF